MRELNPSSASMFQQYLQIDEAITQCNEYLGKLNSEYDQTMSRRKALQEAKEALRTAMSQQNMASANPHLQGMPVHAPQSVQAPQAPDTHEELVARSARVTQDLLGVEFPEKDQRASDNGRSKASNLQFNNRGGATYDLPELPENSIAPVDALTHEEILQATKVIQDFRRARNQEAPPTPNIPIDNGAALLAQKALRGVQDVHSRNLQI